MIDNHHYHHRLFSDSRSIEITIKQHRGQTAGNIQIYTQKDISNTESERDKDRNKNMLLLFNLHFFSVKLVKFFLLFATGFAFR